MSFFPAKPRSLKALKPLQLSRNGAFPKGFQRFGRPSRQLVIRCDASSGRVSLVYFHLAKQKKKRERFWIEFLLLFVAIALR